MAVGSETAEFGQTAGFDRSKLLISAKESESGRSRADRRRTVCGFCGSAIISRWK